MSALYVAPFIILGVAVSASLLYVDGLLTLGQLVATLAVTLVLVTGAVAGWVHTRFRKTVPVGPGAYLVFGTCVGALNTLSSSQDPRDQEAARRLLARWDDMHSWAQEHTRWRCALAGLPRGASDVLARARARAVADQVLGQMVAVAAEAEALAQDAQRRRDQGAARERVAAIRSLLADRTAQA
jgi:hypothetical protein